MGQAVDHNVILSSEHRDYKWLSCAQAMSYIAHTNARDLLQKADDFITKK